MNISESEKGIFSLIWGKSKHSGVKKLSLYISSVRIIIILFEIRIQWELSISCPKRTNFITNGK